MSEPGNARRRGLMLVLSSPSGAGKTTISRRLLAEESADMAMSVSVTTRPQRAGEQDGIDYYFVDQARFAEMVANQELLEHATVFDNSYGTPAAPVEAALAAGRDVLFDVDWQGAQQMKQKKASDIVSIFILPPDTDELERRLRSRARDPEDVIRRRMARAADEISHYDGYDYVVINHDVEACLGEVRTILFAERLRRQRQPWLVEFVSGLMSPR